MPDFSRLRLPSSSSPEPESSVGSSGDSSASHGGPYGKADEPMSRRSIREAEEKARRDAEAEETQDDGGTHSAASSVGITAVFPKPSVSSPSASATSSGVTSPRRVTLVLPGEGVATPKSPSSDERDGALGVESGGSATRVTTDDSSSSNTSTVLHGGSDASKAAGEGGVSAGGAPRLRLPGVTHAHAESSTPAYGAHGSEDVLGRGAVAYAHDEGAATEGETTGAHSSGGGSSLAPDFSLLRSNGVLGGMRAEPENADESEGVDASFENADEFVDDFMEVESGLEGFEHEDGAEYFEDDFEVVEGSDASPEASSMVVGRDGYGIAEGLRDDDAFASEIGGDNPLLDDADDEMLSSEDFVERMSKNLGIHEEVQDSPDELKPFTGFDEQFNALLDEDEEEPGLSLIEESSSIAGAKTVPHGGVSPRAADAAGAGTPTNERSEALDGRSASGGGMLKSGGIGSPEVSSNAKEWNPAPLPHEKEATSTVELEDSAARRKVKRRKKEASEASAREYRSDFASKPAAVVKVNEAGETATEARRERKRVTAVAPKGRLKPSEVEHFKSLGVIREGYATKVIDGSMSTGEFGQKETPEQRREHRVHLERALDSKNLMRSGKSVKMDDKTVDTLAFLAQFRYATHTHIARIFGESPTTTRSRLYRLRQAGIVASKVIYAQHPLWFLTEAGVIVSGFDVKHITESRLTPSMFPHQFTVNHVAANLMGGKLNVLNLPGFPGRNRTNVKGEPALGEELTSELEILSSFGKMRLFEKGSSYRPKLMSMRDREFRTWSEDENRASIPTPELIYGNEWLFTLFPPLSVNVTYHVPDLVVKRQRAVDGTPRSIAVEVEITNKHITSYERTLRAYDADKLIFGQVVWVCKSVGPAKKLEKIGRELGMIQSGKLKIVPIWTEKGVFRGRDLWTI